MVVKSQKITYCETSNELPWGFAGWSNSYKASSARISRRISYDLRTVGVRDVASRDSAPRDTRQRRGVPLGPSQCVWYLPVVRPSRSSALAAASEHSRDPQHVRVGRKRAGRIWRRSGAAVPQSHGQDATKLHVSCDSGGAAVCVHGVLPGAVVPSRRAVAVC